MNQEGKKARKNFYQSSIRKHNTKKIDSSKAQTFFTLKQVFDCDEEESFFEEELSTEESEYSFDESVEYESEE